MSSKRKTKSGDSRPTGELEPVEESLEGARPEPETSAPGEMELEPQPGDQAPEISAEAAAEELEELTPEELRERLLQAQAEAKEYLDGWQRARAEFANYKKRIDREQEESYSRIVGETLLKVLGILDDLERALKDRPAEGDTASWAEGIELIYKKFDALLEAQGVEPIEAEGEWFDPVYHEALSHEDSDDHREGTVIQVVQRGYKLGDRVLRPALVRVAK